MVLPREFYAGEDILHISRQLLGKTICTKVQGKLTTARITELEAYIAPDDRASHAYQWKRTPRNETMYARPGTCYMYICYGIHHLCNVVTGPENLPHAILLRAVEPLTGEDTMLQRRGMSKIKKNLTAGPGLLSQALGLDKSYDATDLTVKKLLWIEDAETISEQDIVQTVRIGIDSAGKAVHYPYRFYIKNNPWVSKK